MQSNATSKTESPWYYKPERGSELGLRFMLLFYRLFGKYITRVLLYPVVLFFFLTDKSGRKYSREFLNRVYENTNHATPLKKPPGLKDDFLRFYNFGCSMVDRIEVWGTKDWTTNVNWHGLEYFDELEEKEGAVVLSAHIGNLDALRVAAKGETKKQIKALVYTKNADRFIKILNIINPDALTDIIPIQNLDAFTIVQLKELIDGGNALGLLADRATAGAPERIYEAPFFGKSAPFPIGPWILAGLLGCRVFTIICVRTRFNQYDVYIEPFADKITFSRKNRKEEIGQWIKQYALFLEKICCQHPHHWFNFYDVWDNSSSKK